MFERGLDTLSARWNGRRWRWWALVTGILLVPMTALVAGLIAALTGNAFEPLLLLFLVIEILVASLFGSGFLESLSAKMIRGGLARESTDYVDAVEQAGDGRSLEERQQEAQDRLTIRAGLIVLPLVATFVYFMTRL